MRRAARIYRLGAGRPRCGAPDALCLAAGRSTDCGSTAGRSPPRACEIARPSTLISIGERYNRFVTDAILIASMPLFVALLAVRLSPAESPPDSGCSGS